MNFRKKAYTFVIFHGMAAVVLSVDAVTGLFIGLRWPMRGTHECQRLIHQVCLLALGRRECGTWKTSELGRLLCVAIGAYGGANYYCYGPSGEPGRLTE